MGVLIALFIVSIFLTTGLAEAPMYTVSAHTSLYKELYDITRLAPQDIIFPPNKIQLYLDYNDRAGIALKTNEPITKKGCGSSPGFTVEGETYCFYKYALRVYPDGQLQPTLTLYYQHTTNIYSRITIRTHLFRRNENSNDTENANYYALFLDPVTKDDLNQIKGQEGHMFGSYSANLTWTEELLHAALLSNKKQVTTRKSLTPPAKLYVAPPFVMNRIKLDQLLRLHRRYNTDANK